MIKQVDFMFPPPTNLNRHSSAVLIFQCPAWLHKSLPFHIWAETYSTKMCNISHTLEYHIQVPMVISNLGKHEPNFWLNWACAPNGNPFWSDLPHKELSQGRASQTAHTGKWGAVAEVSEASEAICIPINLVGLHGRSSLAQSTGNSCICILFKYHTHSLEICVLNWHLP